MNAINTPCKQIYNIISNYFRKIWAELEYYTLIDVKSPDFEHKTTVKQRLFSNILFFFE